MRSTSPALATALPDQSKVCIPLHAKGGPETFLISGPVTPAMRSWNYVMGFLTDWEGLRTLAA